jgi:hypothetical protein
MSTGQASANATSGHGFELDDFAPLATAHPGCVAVPSALSVGERPHLSGKDLLTGVALASEVITRVRGSGHEVDARQGLSRSNCQILWIGSADQLCAEVFMNHLPGSRAVDEHVGSPAGA